MPRPKGDIQARIVAAAKKRFRAESVDGASLRAIARDAKTSIGMIYYYYPSKDDLFLAVVEDTYEGFLVGLQQALAPELDVEQRLRNLFQRIASVSEDELGMVHLIAREALVSSTRLDRLFERFKQGHVPLVLQTIADGLRTGVFDRTRHPFVLLTAIIGLAGPPQLILRGLASRLPLSDLPTPAGLASELVELLLSSVGTRSAVGGSYLEPNKET